MPPAQTAKRIHLPGGSAPESYGFFTGVSATGVIAPLPANHEMMLFATSSSIARRVACEPEPTCGSSTT